VQLTFDRGKTHCPTALNAAEDGHMPQSNGPTPKTLSRDLTAGLIVFLVALPLCLGVALASGAPPLAGLIAGVVGGVLVGVLSGSHTSVNGPATGLATIVAAQIASLGSFQAFLLAVVLAGLIQVGLGLARAGFVAAFVPSSVIKGLLAAIGVLLILKQAPHVVGHDPDPIGDMAFEQPDRENTFTELVRTLDDFHSGAAVIGLLSVAALVFWDRSKRLKGSPVTDAPGEKSSAKPAAFPGPDGTAQPCLLVGVPQLPPDPVDGLHNAPWATAADAHGPTARASTSAGRSTATAAVRGGPVGSTRDALVP
jgi:hypothetical protein